jgi:N-acetylneuraminic acid mutarotase
MAVDVDVATEVETLAFEDPQWRRLQTERAPAAREDHTWTVDSDGRFAYLFGGRGGGQDFGDLWRYDLTNDTWKKLSPKGKRPQPRFGHNAVWVDGYGVIVFAGQRGADFFGDLWVYDPDRNRWKLLPADGGAPKRRYGSCMVVGLDGRLWISHGFTFAGRFDDTRAYNLKSKRWASIGPEGRRPGERCLHDCFTSASGEMVLYGGQDNGALALGDLWVMGSDHDWKRLDDPRPKARRLYAVTEAGDDAWIFGGADQDNAALDDLWRVDRDSLEFRRVKVDGASPPARYAGTLITDERRGRLLLFGGQGKSAKADLWELVDRAAATVETDAVPSEAAEPSSSPSPIS